MRASRSWGHPVPFGGLVKHRGTRWVGEHQRKSTVNEHGTHKRRQRNTAVDGRNPAPVDTTIYKVLYVPAGAGFLPSTILLKGTCSSTAFKMASSRKLHFLMFQHLWPWWSRCKYQVGKRSSITNSHLWYPQLRAAVSWRACASITSFLPMTVVVIQIHTAWRTDHGIMYSCFLFPSSKQKKTLLQFCS